MTSTGRVARLTALALATGTLVAAGSASAATTTTTTDQISGTGKGEVVKLKVVLPAALPVVGKVIEQTISTTNGTVNAGTSISARGVGAIGEGGNQPVLSSILEPLTAVSDLTGKAEDVQSLARVDKLAGILSLKALTATSKVQDPTKNGLLAHSDSTVASITVDAVALPALSAPLADAAVDLENVVGTAQEASSTATNTIAGVLGDVTQQLDAAAGTSSSPAVDAAVASTKSALDQLLEAIQLSAADLNNNPALVDIGVMESTQSISRLDSQVTSEVKNGLVTVSLLGGLVTVTALESEAKATAGGEAKTASVSGQPTVLVIKIANLLTLKLSDKLELTGTIGDALPAALKGTVNDALKTVLGLLRENLGLEFTPSKVVDPVADNENGRFAAITVSAAKFSITPKLFRDLKLIPDNEKFIALDLVSAQAGVTSQIIPNRPPNTPPTAENTTATTGTSLPRTGASLPIAGVAAASLMGLAMVARRRRMAHISE